ncbi:MAG: histidinol-phosphatase [Clostridia bacterium]|nr:histidinol-phosphatase [Clostridia bacterium]
MVYKMEYNYHSHTTLSHHAVGTERAYIERAIAAGIQEMGFSDHAPWWAKNGQYVTPEGRQYTYCVFYEDVPKYVATLRALREEYRDRIALHVGFETEYFQGSYPARLDEFRALGAEYLILGNHFILDGAGNEFYVGGNHGRMDLLPYYVDAIVEGIGTGAFTYVAHPDVFGCFEQKDEDFYTSQMRRLCQASRAHGVPLEINFLGIRTSRYYPTPLFWQLAGEVGCPVTFGMDAHDPDGAADLASFPAAMAIVERYGLNYVGKPRLVRI